MPLRGLTLKTMTCTALTQALFSFDIEKLFDLSVIESMYRADTTDDRTGTSVLDRFSLTNNDRAFYNKLLKRGASEAYRLLQVLCRGLVSAYQFNTNPTNTVEELNELEEYEENLLIVMEDAGTLTLGTVVVVAGDQVYWNGSVWVKDNALTTKYILYYIEIPTYFDLNNMDPLSDKIEEYISMWATKEWFKRHKFDLSLVTEELKTLDTELKRIVNFRTQHTRIIRTF